MDKILGLGNQDGRVVQIPRRVVNHVNGQKDINPIFLEGSAVDDYSSQAGFHLRRFFERIQCILLESYLSRFGVGIRAYAVIEGSNKAPTGTRQGLGEFMVIHPCGSVIPLEGKTKTIGVPTNTT